MKPAISSYGVSDLRVATGVLACDVRLLDLHHLLFIVECLLCFVCEPLWNRVAEATPLLRLNCLVSQPTFKATVPKLILGDEFDWGFLAGHTKECKNIFCHEFIFLIFMLCLVSKNQFNPHLLHCYWMHFLMNLLNLGEQVYILKKVVTRIVQKAPKFTFTLSNLVSLKAVGD